MTCKKLINKKLIISNIFKDLIIFLSKLNSIGINSLSQNN